MNRIFLVTAAALAVVACSRPSPVDAEAVNVVNVPSGQAQFESQHPNAERCTDVNSFLDKVAQHHLVEVRNRGNRVTYTDPKRPDSYMTVDFSPNEVCLEAAG